MADCKIDPLAVCFNYCERNTNGCTLKHPKYRELEAEIKRLNGIIAMQAASIKANAIKPGFSDMLEAWAVIALSASSETVSSILNEVREKALEHCAQYFDVLDETFPMTPPQIAASIRRQSASELRTNKES